MTLKNYQELYNACIKKRETSTAKDRKAYTVTIFIFIKNALNSSDKQLNQWGRDIAIKELEGFIYYMINKHFAVFVECKKDLFICGVIGVLKALKEFNPELTTASSFFIPYILDEMSAYIAEYINRTTKSKSKRIEETKKAITDLENQGISPSAENLAIYFNMSVKRIRERLRYIEIASTYPIDNSTETMLYERMSHYGQPEKTYIETEIKEDLKRCIQKLSDQEQAVILMRYGFDNDKMTFAGIGKEVGRTGRQIRQIHEQAIKKLRIMMEKEGYAA